MFVLCLVCDTVTRVSGFHLGCLVTLNTYAQYFSTPSMQDFFKYTAKQVTNLDSLIFRQCNKTLSNYTSKYFKSEKPLGFPTEFIIHENPRVYTCIWSLMETAIFSPHSKQWRPLSKFFHICMKKLKPKFTWNEKL